MNANPWENADFAQLNLSHIDEKFLPGTSNEVDFLERELHLSPGDTVLDLGCGAGRHAIEFGKRGYHVTAIDISSALLEEANARAKRAGVHIEFRRADLP